MKCYRITEELQTEILESTRGWDNARAAYDERNVKLRPGVSEIAPRSGSTESRNPGASMNSRGAVESPGKNQSSVNANMSVRNGP